MSKDQEWQFVCGGFYCIERKKNDRKVNEMFSRFVMYLIKFENSKRKFDAFSFQTFDNLKNILEKN